MQCEDKTKNTKNDRCDYLNRSADILCKAAYRLCSDSFAQKRGEKKNAPDAKTLKETCCAVKEAIAISESLSRNTDTGAELRVILEGESSNYAI